MDSQFRLQIELDNGAFCEGDNPEDTTPTREIARILRDLADKIDGAPAEHLSMYRSLKDHNGNPVGTYAIKTNEYLKR